MQSKKLGPPDATHFMKDQFVGVIYYKRCELTGKWLFWCIDRWELSMTANLPNAELVPLPVKGDK